MNQKNIVKDIQSKLFELQDIKYRDFHAKLMPTVNKEKIIGVRIPVLRSFAKEFGKTKEAKLFLQVLPHSYYEENNLHGLLLEQIKDYEKCLQELERFLPFIDNWATCDLLAVRTVKKHLDVFIEEVYHWIQSQHTYTIRFGIGMLMRYYLDENFQMEYPEKVMQKLFRMTPLEDSFPCNFNILISGMPRVMGVREILGEWAAFRTECVRRRTYYDLQGKEKRLHLLKGLEAILLDIDKAVRIVRETEEEAEVVPNLMIGFGIDKVQAEYVAEIKLRHLNREYILKRTEEIEELENAIADLEDILKRPARINKIIMKELADVAKKYGKPRRCEIMYEVPAVEGEEPEQQIPDYPVHLFFTRDGYFKKITPQSLRMSGEQKLKDGDEVLFTCESTNSVELLFFTNHRQVYKSHAYDFNDSKASVLGDYVASALGMEEGEVPLYMVVTPDYKGWMLFFYDNGKCAKVPLSSYETKQNRRKLLKAYSDKEELAAMLHIEEETELAVFTSGGTGGPRLILVGSALIPEKATRDTAGINMVTLKKNARIAKVRLAAGLELKDPHRYRVRTLPAAGALLRQEDTTEQMSL